MEQLSLNMVIVGMAFLAGAVAARSLVRLNLWVYRRIGLHGMALFWERRFSRWVSTVRVICVLGSLVFILSGLGIVGTW